jgi:hypothetical protein
MCFIQVGTYYTAKQVLFENEYRTVFHVLITYQFIQGSPDQLLFTDAIKIDLRERTQGREGIEQAEKALS